MTGDAPDTLHATCVAIASRAILIEGMSGSGKSDLALRLIDRGAILVSDDYTRVVAVDGVPTATAPPTMAGRMEIRGLGIATMPYLMAAPVALIVTLGDMDRMPLPATRRVAGCDVRAIRIDPRPASAPILVEFALSQHDIQSP